MAAMTSPARLTQRLTFSASVDQLVLIACVFWAFSANRLFLGAALKQHGDVPVAGFAPNFSPMPRMAPPPFGSVTCGGVNGAGAASFPFS